MNSHRLFAASALAIVLVGLQVEVWALVLAVLFLGWKAAVEFRGLAKPPRWLTNLLTVLFLMLVLAKYRTLLAQEASSTFLMLLTSLKLLEERTLRDQKFLLLLGCVLLSSLFLFSLEVPALVGGLSAFYLLWTSQNSSLNYSKHFLKTLPYVIFLFLFFPRVQNPFGLQSMNNGDQGLTGFSDDLNPGTISRIQTSKDLAFRVSFLKPTKARTEEQYWRGQTLRLTDGLHWTKTPTSSALRRKQTPVFEADYEVTLEPHGRRWLFTWDPTEFVQSKDFSAIPRENGTFESTLGLRERVKYTGKIATAIQPRTSPETMPPNNAEAIPPKETEGLPLNNTVALPPKETKTLPPKETEVRLPGQQAVQTPSTNESSNLVAAEKIDLQTPKVADSVRAFVSSVVAENKNRDAVAQAFLRYFRDQHFLYSKTPGGSSSTLEGFLFSNKKGYCEHYAATLATLLRLAEIPARVVTGYQGGQYNSYGNFWRFTQADAHAWVEYLNDANQWKRVDPTAVVAPERIELGGLLFEDLPEEWIGQNKAREFLTSRESWWLRSRLAVTDTLENLNYEVVLFLLDFNIEKQKELLSEYGSWAIAVGALLLLPFFLQSYWRRRQVSPAEWLLQLLERKARDLGLKREPSETARHFVHRWSKQFPQHSEPLQRWLQAFEGTEYEHHFSGFQNRELRTLIKDLKP